MPPKKFLGLIERPDSASFEPWRHPSHRITLTGILVRFAVIGFFIGFTVLTQPFDAVFKNRSIEEAIFAGFLMGAVLLAAAESNFGPRTLFLYADRVRISHLLGVFPLRYLYGKHEWAIDQLDQVRIDYHENCRSPYVVFESFGEKPVEFGFDSAMEAIAVGGWLQDHGVLVEPDPHQLVAID